MDSAPARIALCRVEDIGVGEARRVEAAGLTVAVYRLEDGIYVTDDACTHGPGSLSEGFIDGDCVVCNFHQGVFNIKTGAVMQPPCMIPVKTYKAVVEDGQVYVEV